MKRVLRRPSPAMIIAIIALVVAMAGSAVAGGAFLPSSKFKKFKSNAVQRLTYVNNTQTVTPSTSGSDSKRVSADCPGGFHPVGGGVKLSPSDQDLWWEDGYLTTTGYAAHVFNFLSGPSNGTALVTVSCVAARATGSPSG